jgi:phytoene dehydrogenase-like protein
VRYDAAIIGAGANGLTAAALLTRAGLKVLLVERAARPGGRLVTENFHPGFAASVFADRVMEVPAEVAALLHPVMPLRVESLPEEFRVRRDAALAHIFAQARERRPALMARLRNGPIASGAAWPGQDLATRPLGDWPALADRALAGRATDPELAGSALTLLAVAGAEPESGGLGALGDAFAAAARGAELRLGEEVGQVEVGRGLFGRRVKAIILADGRQIAADAVISTLDFRRSLLSLFSRELLPPALADAAVRFRMAGGAARLLLALDRPPCLSAPLSLPGDENARAAFRRGIVPVQPPLLVDPVSLRDPSLAPPGCCTLTVTMSAIPARLFDGAWTEEKRLRLAAAALARIEAALPGTLASLVGIRIVTPAEMEERLGVGGGDLDGGQLAPDQMLGLRPAARTGLAGFYLGGGSAAAGPLGTGAAGFAAAMSLLADRA